MRWISLLLVLVFLADVLTHRTVDEVAFLQVGQGDATLLSQGGTNILVDTGPRSDGFDGGQRFVWPELRKRGIRRLDAVFITHFDRDHYGGLGAILERVRVDRVVVVSPDGLSELDWKLIYEIGVRSDQLVILKSAQKLAIGKIGVDVVPGLFGEGVDDNSKSPYLGFDIGNDRVILTGDAPKTVEDTWRGQGVEGGRVIKAGHHGSDQSMSSAWFEAMKPDYVVFSCGRNNPWKHPSLGALGRAEAGGAKVLRTDAQGTVRFRLDSQGKLQLVAGEDGPPLLEFFQR